MDLNIDDQEPSALVVTEKRVRHGESGFSLLELMVVLLIIGILATQIVTGWKSSVPKVKNTAFSMRSDFNYARGEAAKRNEYILIDFFFRGESRDTPAVTMANDGYRICIDSVSDDVCNNDDDVLKEVVFRDEVRYYDRFVGAPDGPDVTAGATPVLWNGDAVSFPAERFIMQPDGTSDRDGSVYLYVPVSDVLASLPAPAAGTPDPAAVIDVPPFAVVTNNIGRVRLVRWQPFLDSGNGDWSTK